MTTRPVKEPGRQQSSRAYPPKSPEEQSCKLTKLKTYSMSNCCRLITWRLRYCYEGPQRKLMPMEYRLVRQRTSQDSRNCFGSGQSPSFARQGQSLATTREGRRMACDPEGEFYDVLSPYVNDDGLRRLHDMVSVSGTALKQAQCPDPFDGPSMQRWLDCYQHFVDSQEF